jgi:hypothetical protein
MYLLLANLVLLANSGDIENDSWPKVLASSLTYFADYFCHIS